MRLRHIATVGLLLLAAGCAHHAADAPNVADAVSSAADSIHASANDTGSGHYAWSLLERRCQRCHALPDPRSHTRERWVKGIDGMRRRLTLSAADWDSLLALVPADTAAAAQ